MDFIKKYWYVTLLVLGTVGLGITTLLISFRLQQQSSITTSESEAATAECTVNFTLAELPPSCRLSFSLNIPTSTPTATIRPSNTPTPTPTTTPIPSSTPTNTPVPSSTPTNTPRPTNTPIPSGTPTNTPTPSTTPSATNTTTPTGTLALTNTPRPTNTPAPGACNSACNSNADCANNLVCSEGSCRNSSCTEQPNCACYFVPTPKVPVTGTGTTLLGIGVIAGGVLLLLLGLVF